MSEELKSSIEHDESVAEKTGRSLPELELKVTDNGIEYKEYTFKRSVSSNSKNEGEIHTARLFMSMSPARLVDENETYEEYTMRRDRIKYATKEKKKGNTLWTPYPFGKNTKGMVYNEKNREVMKALGEQYQKIQKENQLKEIKKEEV